MTDDRFSTPVLLYGVLDADAATDDAFSANLGTGVQAQPVSVVESSGFAVLLSPVTDRSDLRASSTDDVLVHQSVVDAAFACRTVLPIRCGTIVDGPGELDDWMAGQTDSYRDALERLDGRAEMDVRLTLSKGRTRPAVRTDTAYRADRPGTAYLLARQQQRDVQQGRRRRAARAYRTALADLTERTITSAGTAAFGRRADAGLSMAFLILRDRADAFRDAVARVDAPGVEDVEIAGPSAPFSFV